ncbi:MAG: aminoacyl-tRNA hydrolase, partial [Acidimicrobiales bacterium]
GNPGREFAHTRHNAGADAVATVADRNGIALRPERGLCALAAARSFGKKMLVLAIPVTYMNDSGIALVELIRRYSVTDTDHLVVVHDELDLPVGAVRVKTGGGTAGHNGLRSIAERLGTLDFIRIRIGIGKPPGHVPGVDYVLRRPTSAEAPALASAIELAADAAEMIFDRGIAATMDKVNAS